LRLPVITYLAREAFSSIGIGNRWEYVSDKPIVSKTLEELAAALGLSTVQAKEWQLQHALLKRLKEIVRGPKDHACRGRKKSRYFANQSDRNFERRSRTRIE